MKFEPIPYLPSSSSTPHHTLFCITTEHYQHSKNNYLDDSNMLRTSNNPSWLHSSQTGGYQTHQMIAKLQEESRLEIHSSAGFKEFLNLIVLQICSSISLCKVVFYQIICYDTKWNGKLWYSLWFFLIMLENSKQPSIVKKTRTRLLFLGKIISQYGCSTLDDYANIYIYYTFQYYKNPS